MYTLYYVMETQKRIIYVERMYISIYHSMHVMYIYICIMRSKITYVFECFECQTKDFTYTIV